MKGSFLGWFDAWALHARTRDFFPAFAGLVGQYKIIFPHRTVFQFICPIIRQAGQAVVQGRLSLMFVSLKEFITWEEQIKCVLLLYLSAIVFDSFKYVSVWVCVGGGWEITYLHELINLL